MKQEEDWLRQACGELAEEETDQLAKGLSPDERRQAETLYRRHKKTALALLRRKSARSAAAPYLRAAAILALLLGAVYFSLRQSQPEKVPFTQAPAITVAPYYTDVPSPAPVTAAPTAAPTQEPAPTATPIPLTATPVPTPTPTPTPAPEPTSTPEPETSVSHHPPVGWTGNYFPTVIPDEASAYKVSVFIEDGRISTTYTAEQGGWAFRFTEYVSSVAVPVPEEAVVSYVQIAEGIIALRTETAEGVTLAWDQEGQTLSLFLSGDAPLDAGIPLEIARSVKKISAP